MACAATHDIEICMGATWRRIIMWNTEPFIYKAITAVPQLAPLRLTVVGHGLVSNQRVAISNVRGMTQLNAENEPPDISEYLDQTVIDVDTIEINSVNAVDFRTYTSGGYIRTFTPVDLTGYLARMDIKDKIGGTILFSLTTTNGRIEIDLVTKKITLLITDEETAAFTWKKGVYTLEMETAGEEVIPLITGKVAVMREVTTTETP